MANTIESKPLINPTEVESPITPAECELGIPPVVVKILKLIFLLLIVNIINLISCAKNAAINPEKIASIPVFAISIIKFLLSYFYYCLLKSLTKSLFILT